MKSIRKFIIKINNGIFPRLFDTPEEALTFGNMGQKNPNLTDSEYKFFMSNLYGKFEIKELYVNEK